MLTLAKSLLRQIIETLRPQIEAGVPIVGLEPSCVAVFRDELGNLFPNDEDARRLSQRVYLLSEFLAHEVEEYQPHSSSARRSCTAIAITRPSWAWTRRPRCSPSSVSIIMCSTLGAAVWLVPLALRPVPTTCRWPLASMSCSRPCARLIRRPSSLRTALAVANRLPRPPTARPCI